MIIYYYGCKCGKTGSLIRKVEKYGRENNIEVITKNSKYNEEHRITHSNYLRELGISNGSYSAIIVEDNKITELDKWQIT